MNAYGVVLGMLFTHCSDSLTKHFTESEQLLC